MVQLDYDENEEPRHAEHGNVPIQLEVQRATKWAEMWALYVALDTLEAPAVIFSDNSGVVPAAKRRDCVHQLQARKRQLVDIVLE